MLTTNLSSTTDWGFIAKKLISKPESALETFKQFNINFENLKKFGVSPEVGEPYGRSSLFQSDSYEVMLATWQHGFECAPHNHGYSSGLVWLVAGHFIENTYSFNQTLQLEKTIVHGLNEVLNINNDDIHSMSAPLGGMSLHIYSPPIAKMKVYDIKDERILVVSDNCGAWVPSQSKYIVSESLWPKQKNTNI